jgi:threonine dehydratase
LKIDATRAYGAEIIFVENPADRAKVCARLAAETGATLIPPYDHENIILGQGTVMYEFQRQMKEDFHTALDAVVIPVGGGGLLAGCALACIETGIKVFGAEPQLADDCERGVEQGSRAHLETTPMTIADGLRTEVGELNFGVIQKHVERILTVSEEEIALAMKIVIERLKVVIEPSAAVAVAVALFNPTFKEIIDKEGIKTLGIVLEGGNIDTGSYEKMMPWIHLTGSAM